MVNMKKINFKKIVEGEYLSFTSYYKVKEKIHQGIIVTNQHGQDITITGVDLIETFASAGQFVETRKAGKHEMVEAIHNAKDTVFTVCFKKKDGSERILVGHLKSVEAHLGRTEVIDLEIDKDDKTRGIRLVDNRTLEWVIINNIKYINQ